MSLRYEWVKELFSHLEKGNRDIFFQHVAEDVKWQVMGTHPLAGTYHSKNEFFTYTFARLNKILRGGVVMKVHNIIIAGSTAVVEMSQLSTGINNQPFNNTYCWIVQFKNETIIEVRAYLDSALVSQFILENESAK